MWPSTIVARTVFCLTFNISLILSEEMRVKSPLSLRYFYLLFKSSLKPMMVKLALTKRSKSIQMVLTALLLNAFMILCDLNVAPRSKVLAYRMNMVRSIC